MNFLEKIKYEIKGLFGKEVMMFLVKDFWKRHGKWSIALIIGGTLYFILYFRFLREAWK